ncbi:MAG TPA: TonB-dependent receptor [Gemmatimonadales bacterium]|nr:TonB-dependent receptor [Gemmatimonadales bacterium]
MTIGFLKSSVRLLRGGAALALLLVGTGRAAAQDRVGGSVEGIVTTESGSRIAGASVAVGAPAHISLSDSAGRFRFDGIAPGDQRLEIRALGYRTVAQLVTVRVFETTRVEAVLRAAAVNLPDLVVSTSREEQLASRTPLSVAVIGAAEIAEARSHHPADLVNRAAGVYVSNAGGEGHFTAIRQPITTKAVYAFLEDGVPTRSTGFFNHNGLYEINLPQAGRIEVIKGPGTAIYGSDAVGGVVNSFTRDPSAAPEAELFVEGGSNTYLRALGTASTTSGRHGFRIDANITSSDGYRDGASYARQSGTARWDLALSEAARLKTIATFSHIDQPGDGGGEISAEDFAATPSRVYTQVAFRRVLAGRLSSELQVTRGASSFGATAFARYNELDLLPSWQLSFDPQVWESRHRSIGLLTRFRRTIPQLGASVSTGVDAEYSPGSRRETRIVAPQTGNDFLSYTEAEVQYDYDVDFWQASPYAQADVAIAEGLQVNVGVRFDNLGYDYANDLGELVTGSHRRPASTSVSFSRLSPKLGAAWEVRPNLSLFASYRAAFRAPSESQLFRQGRAESTVDLEPVKANSFEAGVRTLVGGIMTFEATAYSMRLTDDILTFLDPETGLRLTQNAGATSHRGVEVGLGVAPVPAVRLDASLAYARHRYERWSPGGAVPIDYSGNEMELAPRFFGTARLTLKPVFVRDGSFAVELVRLGSYFMDPANAHEYGGHSLLNLQANVPVYAGLDIVARVSNVTGERYAETSSFNAQQGERFRPGAPRQLFVGAQYRFTR